MSAPAFKIIRKREASIRRKFRRPKRSWTEVITQIADTVSTQKAVFIPDADLSDADVKYLMLALKRRGKNEYLRTQREVFDGVEGRLLWAEIVP